MVIFHSYVSLSEGNLFTIHMESLVPRIPRMIVTDSPFLEICFAQMDNTSTAEAVKCSICFKQR